MSVLVTMVYKVVADLRAFLIFFFIMIVLYGLMFAVIGAGNQNVPGDFQVAY